jgi:2-phosphosulfolactate phosphatase
MQVFYFFTPESVPSLAADPLPIEPPDCAVVVDVLRATTTIATALQEGAEGIQVFADLEELQRGSQTWPAAARLLAGERGGEAVAGFDLGNSPLSYTRDRVQGKRIFMSTTNGTRALQRVQSVSTVVTAALVNLEPVQTFLAEERFQRIWIVGSGWQGAYALEDSVCAGAILDALGALKDTRVKVGNDEVLSALALYQQWKGDLLGLLRYSSHGQRLLRLGPEYEKDLAYCATLSSLAVLPRQIKPGLLGL